MTGLDDLKRCSECRSADIWPKNYTPKVRCMACGAFFDKPWIASAEPQEPSATPSTLATIENDWRILRERKWDWHDQHAIVRPFVDMLVAALRPSEGPPSVLEGLIEERIRVDDETPHDDTWPLVTKGEARQLLVALREGRK